MMSAGDENKTKNRRRFQRVLTRFPFDALNQLMGIGCVWEDGSTGEVYDLSYGGCALLKPKNIKAEVGSHHQFKFTAPNGTLEVRAKISWVGESNVGLQFAKLSDQARLRLEQILSDKLIGANLRSIDPKYFAEQLDCDVWYHGPKDTDIFLWLKEGSPRAEIEFEGESLEVRKGQVIFGHRQVTVKELSEKEVQILERILNILGQVPEKPDELRPLLEEISQLILK